MVSDRGDFRRPWQPAPGVILLFLPPVFYILLGTALTVFTAIALGRLLLRGIALRFAPTEEYVFAFVTGSACLSWLVFPIAAAGLVYKGVFFAMAAAAAGVFYFTPKPHRTGSRPKSPSHALVPIVLAIFAGLYLLIAMLPEMSPDGSSYHLGLVNRYLHEHGFHRITTNIYASLSQGLEMLFLFAFSIGRHSSAALVHLAFLVCLAAAIVCYGRRIDRPLAGLVGAALVFCSPVMGVDATSAYNDVAVACILFAVFYLLEIWDEERTPALLIPIGLLAGFAYAVKYTAFPAVPYALGFVAFRTRSSKAWRLCGTVLLAALVMIVPWMAKNWLEVQNPFAPFFNSVFPNPYVHISFERDYINYLRHYIGVTSYWQIPLQLTVQGNLLGGVFGPVFLLAPLALLSLAERRGRRLMLAAAIFGLSYMVNIGTRFLIPALPFVALAMALVFTRWKALAISLVLVHAVLSWPAVAENYARYAWHMPEVSVRAALRLEGEEHYLIRKMPGYVSARTIESFVPPGKKVFAGGGMADAYTNREILVKWQGALNERIGDMLWAAFIPEWRTTRRLTFRFAPGAYRKFRVVQTAQDNSDQWSISEFRLFRGTEELAPSPQWRAQAQPFPWDAHLVLDRNPVTRWRTWQAIYPGMYFEVELPNPEKVDAVALDGSRDQGKTTLRLEGQTASGAWKQLGESPENTTIPAPPDLRRITVRTIQALGIDYIVMDKGDFGSDDLRQHAAEWGITEVAERGAMRLYRID